MRCRGGRGGDAVKVVSDLSAQNGETPVCKTCCDTVRNYPYTIVYSLSEAFGFVSKGFGYKNKAYGYVSKGFG